MSNFGESRYTKPNGAYEIYKKAYRELSAKYQGYAGAHAEQITLFINAIKDCVDALNNYNNEEVFKDTLEIICKNLLWYMQDGATVGGEEGQTLFQQSHVHTAPVGEQGLTFENFELNNKQGLTFENFELNGKNDFNPKSSSISQYEPITEAVVRDPIQTKISNAFASFPNNSVDTIKPSNNILKFADYKNDIIRPPVSDIFIKKIKRAYENGKDEDLTNAVHNVINWYLNYNATAGIELTAYNTMMEVVSTPIDRLKFFIDEFNSYVSKIDIY
jgi:hypothetical protein